MNIIILSGHLGNDPEMRLSQAGKPVTKFRLATTSGWGDNKRTDWHNIVCFGKTAENCDQYLLKGSRVNLRGSVKYGQWEKDGITKYFTDILADHVDFISTTKNDRSAERPQSTRVSPDPGGFDDGFTSDDIPF